LFGAQLYNSTVIQSRPHYKLSPSSVCVRTRTTMMQTMEQSPPNPIQYASPPTPPASNTGSPSSKSAVVLTETPTTEMTIAHHHHILIVTGPAGCGKSTIAKHLSDRYGFDYIEGDEVSGHYTSS